MRIDVTTRLDEPVELVFPYLAEPSRWHEFTPAVEERRQIGTGPPGVGTKWSAVDRIGLMRVRFIDEMVALEENRRVVWRHSAPWNGVTEYRCEPADGGTRLLMHFEAKPSGRLSVVRLMPSRLVTRVLEGDFGRLRARLAADRVSPGSEHGPMPG